MSTVGDILRRYGPEYLERFGDAMPCEQKKALRAIMACRTGDLGWIHYACTGCGRRHTVARSCGNRHCPACQQHKSQNWLQKQTERLLPTHYFLITFTLPAELRRLIRSHPRVGYDTLFSASSEALKKLAADERFVGTGSIGFFGVLHSWGRALEYHPHVHYVVPGGAISDDGNHWKSSRADLFVPVQALSVIFRAKFRHALRRHGLIDQVDPKVWERDWVVNSKAVGDGRASLKYLAPYVFRVAITDNRVVSCQDEGSMDRAMVKLSVCPTGSRRYRQIEMTAREFLRRFLQHILPRGFQKVRHYGFLSQHSKHSLDAIRWIITIARNHLYLLCTEHLAKPDRPSVVCCECGAPVVSWGWTPPLPIPAARDPPHSNQFSISN